MDIRTSEELSFEQPTNQEMWGECLLGIYKSLEVISGQLEALLHARQTDPDLLTDLDLFLTRMEGAGLIAESARDTMDFAEDAVEPDAGGEGDDVGDDDPPGSSPPATGQLSAVEHDPAEEDAPAP